MQRSKHPRLLSHQWFMVWLAISAMALLTAPVLIAEPPSEETSGEPVATPGLRAYIDPQTGEVTNQPSREQIEALSKQLEPTMSRSSVGLEPFALSRGGRGVFLDNRFQSALIARVRTDGSIEISGLEMSCVNDAHIAAELLASGPLPAAPTTQWAEK